MSTHGYPRIDPADIRKGDTIRIEYSEADGFEILVATEYLAREDGDRGLHGGATFFLVNRPVELPTTVYSMVVPPRFLAHELYPYILQYNSDGELMWTHLWDRIDEERVKARVHEGWHILERTDAEEAS